MKKLLITLALCLGVMTQNTHALSMFKEPIFTIEYNETLNEETKQFWKDVAQAADNYAWNKCIMNVVGIASLYGCYKITKQFIKDCKEDLATYNRLKKEGKQNFFEDCDRLILNTTVFVPVSIGLFGIGVALLLIQPTIRIIEPNQTYNLG